METEEMPKGAILQKWESAGYDRSLKEREEFLKKPHDDALAEGILHIDFVHYLHAESDEALGNERLLLAVTAYIYFLATFGREDPDFNSKLR